MRVPVSARVQNCMYSIPTSLCTSSVVFTTIQYAIQVLWLQFSSDKWQELVCHRFHGDRSWASPRDSDEISDGCMFKHG